MDRFPLTLQHGSGATLMLDRTRLLLAFKEQQTREQIETLLHDTSLMLEDAGEVSPALPSPSPEVVNQTGERYWVRSHNGEPLDERILAAVEHRLQPVLDWIGPVYRFPETEGRGGLLCPLPNVLVIKPAPGAGEEAAGRLAEALSQFGLIERESTSKYLSGGYRYFVIDDLQAHSSYEARDALLSQARELVAEADFANMPMLLPTGAFPNDPLYPWQHNMQRIQAGAQTATDRSGWDISTGDADLVVCVLDTGCDLDHPDLTIATQVVDGFVTKGINAGWLTGPKTTPPVPGSPRVSPAQGLGSEQHGTMMAGIIAGRFHNGIGVAGVAGNCQIMPVALQNWDDIEVAAGIRFAADNGARVINLSIFGYKPDEALPGVKAWNPRIIDPAIEHAFQEKGCVLCACTGNDNNRLVNGYPASHPLVIACGAADLQDNRWVLDPAVVHPDLPPRPFGSNCAPGVSVVAPSVGILTTMIHGTPVNGFPADYNLIPLGMTSAATAHVSGLAALLLSRYPTLTNVQVRDIIERTADRVGKLPYDVDTPNGWSNQDLGHGRINVLHALDLADVLIKDYLGDTGAEPSIPPDGDTSSFCDIVVRPADDGVFEPAGGAATVQRGQSNVLYVRVTNAGPAEARNVTVNARLVPNVGTNFRHTDWTDNDAFHLPPISDLNTFASIPAGGSAIARFTIPAAVAEGMWLWTMAGWQPCVLAEVTAENDYAYGNASQVGPELARRRNNLAQRNLVVAGEPIFTGAGGGSQPAGFRTSLLRPDDLLNLQVEGINLQLDASDPANPVLVAGDAGQEAFLIVHFPPQTTTEQAFFESGETPEQVVKPPEVKRKDQLAGKKPDELETLKPAGQVAARLGGPTRLVFRVPGEARIPFNLEGLLDWSKFDLNVAPIADVAPNAEPPDAALSLRPPKDDETSLELPYRLQVSPGSSAAWDHASQVVTHAGRAELWHTRLASRKPDGAIQRTDNDHTLPLRALWATGFDPDNMPIPGDFGPIGALSPMSPFDRHQIVVLTSAFRGYAADPYTQYTPQPFQASLLMLSPLGGWLRSFGMWEPPFKIKPKIRFDRPKWRDYFQIHRVEPGFQFNNALMADAGAEEQPAARADAGAEPGAEQGVNPLAFDNLAMFDGIEPAGRRDLADLLGDPGLIFAYPLYDLGQQLDLSQWAHISAQGRDHYVRIVYEGKLKQLGHRASLIKVTERRFEEAPGTHAPVAYLRQYMYIVVREPEKDYGKEGLQHEGRGMLLRKIRLTTLVTPKIRYPYPYPQNPINDPNIQPYNPAAVTDRSFWVMVGEQDFRFHAIGEDVGGNRVDFTTPLIFVPNSEQDYPKIHAHFNLPETIQRREAAVPGQKVAFAEAPVGNDNTSFATISLNFENEDASRENFFKPRLFKAEVRIPAVEQLTGANKPTTIHLFQPYLDKGFEDPSNATGVFAEVVTQDALGNLKPAGLGVEFAAQQAGGFATPSLDITSLSRNLGPLGGKIDDALTNTFDPGQVFKKGLAKLFGAFDLADLLPTGSADKDAPKMQVRRNGTAVIAELDWKTAVDPHLPPGIIEFHQNPDTQLVVHGVFKKDLGAPTNDEFTLTGDLNHFDILFFKVMQINFVLFSFKAQSGRKTDVNVKLDDSTPIEFKGDLEFVEGLRSLIPPGVFGDGVSIDLIKNPLGVKAGLSISLPPASVGVFALKNIALSAGLTVPFLDGKAIVDFGFARRDNPFLLTVAFLGGGGFFHIELDTDGIRMLDAAFEFGAAAAIDIGVASGEVHIMAGIYFKMEKKVSPEHGNKEVMVSLLTGYLRCGGKLSVLGLVSVCVEFVLSFTYNSDTEKASGRATLTVTIEVACFSKSVELTVERSFGGKGGDPTFADLIDSPAVWGEYAGAFA
jgi:subtilisin family serine protease